MTSSVALSNVEELRLGQKPLGGLSLGTITLDHSTPNGRVEFMSTNPAGWNTGVGRMTFDAEVTINNYFTANPNGHFVIILRQDPALIMTAARGQGVAIGNATSFPFKPSDLNPTPLLETLFNLLPNGNFTYPNSEGARSAKMVDGQTYRIIVDSTKTNDGNRYLRYRMYIKDVTYGDWVVLSDTGDVLDFETGADLTKTGFWVGHVIESNLVTWSLVFANAKLTWGPAENPVPDQTLRLSRYGAQLEGNLNFLGNARRIQAPFNAGPSLDNWLSIQTSTANSATSVVVKPNGTSQVANLLFSNDGYSTTTYQAVTFGMSGSLALLECLALGAATPSFGVNIGIANRVATFATNGLTILSAAKPIGQSIGFSAGLTNFGASQQATFATTATLDWDAVSTAGYITSYITASYNPGKIDEIVRPLWCMLGYLIADLKAKKVI